MQLLDHFAFLLGESIRGQEERVVRVPFEPGAVDQSRAADCYLADGVREGGARADGAEESVPACELRLEGKLS